MPDFRRRSIGLPDPGDVRRPLPYLRSAGCFGYASATCSATESQRFFVFEKAMELMAADPDIDMGRLAGGKGRLHAATPDPTDPGLVLPDDLKEWRTIYEIINDYGGIGFGQTVWNVTLDPDFKMNGSDPYGGVAEPTKGETSSCCTSVISPLGWNQHFT